MRPVRVTPTHQTTPIFARTHTPVTLMSAQFNDLAGRRPVLWRLCGSLGRAKRCRLQVCRHHVEECQELTADTHSPRPRKHLPADRRTVRREIPTVHTSHCNTQISRNPSVARRRITRPTQVHRRSVHSLDVLLASVRPVCRLPVRTGRHQLRVCIAVAELRSKPG